MMLRPATFIMKVFRAEDLPRMDSMFFHGIKSIFSNNEQKKELIDPYVVFSFAGKKVNSELIVNTSNTSKIYTQRFSQRLSTIMQILN